MINEATYFTIHAWMVTKLKLKGCERDVYAIIYGYSQDGESDFHGSLTYLSELTGYSKNAICTALKSLTEKNLIIKAEQAHNNSKVYRYTSNLNAIQVTCIPIQVTCINNIDNNKINNNNSKELLLQKNPKTRTSSVKTKRKNVSTLFTPGSTTYNQCIALLDSYDFSQNSTIRNLVIQYLTYRMQITEKPLYVSMWKGMLNKLAELCDNDIELYKAVVQQSLERGYLSFYPISKYAGNSVQKRVESSNIISDAMTDEDYEELDRLTRERRRRGLQAEF